MPTNMEESPPPMSDLVIKTRRQSLLDSPSRVTRGQLRRLSSVLPSDGTMSPLPSPPRRRQASKAGDEEEESEATSPPRRGRARRVQDEDTAPPSSPARSTRARRSVSSTNEEPPKDTISRRVSNRLQSIVEDTQSVSTRRSSARTMSKHPSQELLELPITRRTRRSSLSSVTSVASSVASPTRRTRSRKKLSPVASPTASELDVVDIVSPEKRTASPSPSKHEMSTINDTPVKSLSLSPKRTPRALNADARLSCGKKIGVVSPSRISPLKSPHSTSKNVTGSTPRTITIEESDSPSVSEAGSDVFLCAQTAPQESKTSPGKVITETNLQRTPSEQNRLSSSRKSLSGEKPKTTRKSFAQDEVSGLTESEKLASPESRTLRVSLPLCKTPVESSKSETCVEEHSLNVSPVSTPDGSSALSETKTIRSLFSRKSSSPGTKILVDSELSGERKRKSSTCNSSTPSESSSEDGASVDISVKDESNEQLSGGIPSKSPTKSATQDTCLNFGTVDRFGKSTPNKTIDGKSSAKWLETSLISNTPGKTPEKSPKTNKVESEESSGLAHQKSPFIDPVKISPSKSSQAPKSFDGSDDETESSPDFSKLTESKSDESEDFGESDIEVYETAVSPKTVPAQSGPFVKKTPGKSPLKETPGMSTSTSSALKAITPAKTPAKTPVKKIETPGKSSASSTPKGYTPRDTGSATSATSYSSEVLAKPLNSHDADTGSEESIEHSDQTTEVSGKNMVASLKGTPTPKTVADSNDESFNSSIQSGEMTEFVNDVPPRASELIEYTSDESDEGNKELDKSIPLSGKKSSVGRLAKSFVDIMSEEDEDVPSDFTDFTDEEPSDLKMILSSKREKSLTPGKNSADESLSHNSSQKISLQMDVSDIDPEIGRNNAGLSKSSVKSTNAGWSVSSKVMRDVANLLSQDFPSSNEGSGDEQVWSPVFTPSTKSKKELRAEKKEKRRAEKEARKNAKMTRISKFKIAANGEDLGESPEKGDGSNEGNGHEESGRNITNSSEDIEYVAPPELNKSFTAADFDGLFSDEESRVKDSAPKKTKAQKKAERELRKKQQKLNNLESTCLPIQHENVDKGTKCDKPKVERNVSERNEATSEVGERQELDMKQKLDSLEELNVAIKTENKKKRKNKKKKQASEGDQDLNLELNKKRHHSNVEIEVTKPNKKQKKECIDESAPEAVNEPSSSVINASKNKQKVEPEVDTKGSKMKTKQKKKLKQDDLSNLSGKKLLQKSMKPCNEEEKINSTEAPPQKKKLEKHSDEKGLKKRKREDEMESIEAEIVTKKLKKRKKEIEIDSVEAESMTKKLKKKKKLKRLETGKLGKSSDTPVERNLEDLTNGGSDSDDAPTSVSFSAGRIAALESFQAAAANALREQERKREKRRLKQQKLQEQKAEKLQRLQEKLKKKECALQVQETRGDSGASKSGFIKDGIPKRLPEDMLRVLTAKSGAVAKHANEIGKKTSVSAPTNELQKQRLEKIRAKKLARKLEKKNLKMSDYIPLEAGSSGATRFGVVPLRNIMTGTNKMAEDAVKFRKEMLFGSRVKRTPVSTILAHQEKLKAAGKDKFVRAFQ